MIYLEGLISNYQEIDEMDKIDHIAVVVTNIQKGIQWYTQNRNCKIKYEDDTWALLEFDNIDLALVLPADHPPHIAFEDKSLVGGVEHRDGSKSVYDHDTFGNIIERIKYKKK